MDLARFCDVGASGDVPRQPQGRAVRRGWVGSAVRRLWAMSSGGCVRKGLCGRSCPASFDISVFLNSGRKEARREIVRLLGLV